MEYEDIRKIDEESLRNLKEGKGPTDECLCSILSPEDEKPSFRKSITKALASLGQKKKKKSIVGRTIDIPLAIIEEDAKGCKHSKEVVKRKSSCRKCGCDDNKTVLKHSYANIRITSPDVSSICPCSSNCFSDKDKFKNNIKVTIERVECQSIIRNEDSTSLEAKEREPTRNTLETPENQSLEINNDD